MTGYENKYAVDVVLCIDGGRNMAPIMAGVIKIAMGLHNKIKETLWFEDREIEEYRTKIIVFRDYKCDAEPMTETEFFTLPEQNVAFERALKGIEAKGGGENAENALEAIAYALKSDWSIKCSGRRRQIIVVFSNASYLPLGARSDCPGYPTDLPKTMPELSEIWTGSAPKPCGNFVPKFGRMMLLVPNDGCWMQFESFLRTIVIYGDDPDLMEEKLEQYFS